MDYPAIVPGWGGMANGPSHMKHSLTVGHDPYVGTEPPSESLAQEPSRDEAGLPAGQTMSSLPKTYARNEIFFKKKNIR